MNIEIIPVDVAYANHITNSYIVYGNDNFGIVIDPGFESEKIINKINKLNLTISYIVITHAHADHMGALEDLVNYTHAKVIVHEEDFLALLNKAPNYHELLNVKLQNIKEEDVIKVKDGYEFKVGNLEFEVIHTPGHTKGSICLFEKNSNNLFTGDTIFCDCHGRCDLYSGNFADMLNSIRKLFNRFSNIMIYPGHDRKVNIDSAKKKIRLLLAIKDIHI